MQLSFITVDVFNQSRYSGNQLAIVRVPVALRDKVTEEHKLQIANEFNLSETVFLHDVSSATDSIADYDIFGSHQRLAWAGHPTIGTAIFVMDYARSDFPNVSSLRTPLAGLVPYAFAPEARTVTASVPHNVHIHQTRLPHNLASKDATPESATDVPMVSIVKGMTFILAPLADLDALASVKAGLVPVEEVHKGLNLDSGWETGYIGTLYYCDVTNEYGTQDPKQRFLRTRMLSARSEDPGTGSASSALGAYLALQEPAEIGNGFEYRLTQGVEMGRMCDITVTVEKTADGKEIQKIGLQGSAVKVMEGTLDI